MTKSLFLGSEDFDEHFGGTFDANAVGGATGHVDDTASRAAVVDLHYHLQPCILVGDQHIGAQFDFPMGGGEEVLIEDFPAGGLAALEAVVVEGPFHGIFGHSVVDVVVLRP